MSAQEHEYEKKRSYNKRELWKSNSRLIDSTSGVISSHGCSNFQKALVEKLSEKKGQHYEVIIWYLRVMSLKETLLCLQAREDGRRLWATGTTSILHWMNWVCNTHFPSLGRHQDGQWFTWYVPGKSCICTVIMAETTLANQEWRIMKRCCFCKSAKFHSDATSTISDVTPRFYNPAVDFDIFQHFFDNLQNFSTFSTFFDILRQNYRCI